MESVGSRWSQSQAAPHHLFSPLLDLYITHHDPSIEGKDSWVWLCFLILELQNLQNPEEISCEGFREIEGCKQGAEAQERSKRRKSVQSSLIPARFYFLVFLQVSKKVTVYD